MYILEPGKKGLSVIISQRQRIPAASVDPKIKSYHCLAVKFIGFGGVGRLDYVIRAAKVGVLSCKASYLGRREAPLMTNLRTCE